MRPACLRNARSLASQPSPLLPLLAPHAFAVAPHSTGHDGSRSSKEQKEARAALEARADGGISLGTRYVDIFSFARQQLRTYSTKVQGAADADAVKRRNRRHVLKERVAKLPEGNLVKESSKAPHARDGLHDSAAQQPQPLSESQASTSPIRLCYPRQSRTYRPATDNRLHIRKTATVEDLSDRTTLEPNSSPQPLSDPKLTAVSEQRRQKQLDVCRRNIGYFRTYEASAFPDLKLTEHGKYRSLQRRILSLSARSAQEIDLQKPFNFQKDTRGKSIAMIFAALDRRIFPGLKRRSYPITILHHELCASWTAQLFKYQGAGEAENVWRNWGAFDDDTKEQYWAHILVYLLDKSPQRALPFMQALTHQPCVKSLDMRIVADAFEHFTRIYLNKGVLSPVQMNELQHSKPEFVPTFYHAFKQHLALHNRICSQDLLFSLTKLASVEEIRRVFDLFQESNTYMGYDVLLHYAATFAKAGDFKRGLTCLKVIAEGADNRKTKEELVNQQRFKWTCALILHRSMLNKESYHDTTGIVAAFVELGVVLDTLLYNVIMHNAMEAGDYSTAFKVYNTLDENGLKPDKFTFSTLLHGCSAAPDPFQFQDFADYSAETAKEMRDPWLAADYLYFQYVCVHRKSRNAEELAHLSEGIMETYLQFFSARPLEPFWSANSTLAQQNRLTTQDGILRESVFMDPPPMALNIMLQLKIVKASSSIDTTRVWTLYQRFKSLVSSNHDRHLSKLAQDPIIWNAFLLSFCRAKKFEYASNVVSDMPEYGVQPNVYTWNIFLQGFFKDRQLQAAERVYEIMRARGIEPDQFTYEVLLRGYARAQHVRKIGEVMEHFDDDKQEDPKLLRALARIHDQKRVLLELEKARVKKEERRAQNEVAEATAKRRWVPPKFMPLVEAKEDTVNIEEGVQVESSLESGSAPSPQFSSAVKK